MQTAYTQALAVGRAGMLADNGPRDVISKNASASVVPFGVAVVQGAADNECALPAASTDVTGQGKLLGLALVDMSVESQALGGSQTVPEYLQGQMVAVLKKGRAWVTVEEAVTPASPVFVRFATGTGTQLGAFRASADTATAVQAAGWRYITTQATPGGLAQVELNLP